MQVCFLNAQEAYLESEVEEEFLSGYKASGNSNREDTDSTDLARVELDTPGSNRADIDIMLSLISISGSADLKHCVRLLCCEYSVIFSPTVRNKQALVPPSSVVVNKDKWTHKRNRGSPRFLTRNKDIDLRNQIASLESLGVVERSTLSEYSQVHLVRKPDNSWWL